MNNIVQLQPDDVRELIGQLTVALDGRRVRFATREDGLVYDVGNGWTYGRGDVTQAHTCLGARPGDSVTVTHGDGTTTGWKVS